VYSSLGGSGTNTGVNVGSLIIQLKDKKERKRTTDDVSNDIAIEFADLPDAKLIVNRLVRVAAAGGAVRIFRWKLRVTKCPKFSGLPTPYRQKL